MRVHVAEVVGRRACEAGHGVELEGIAFGCLPVFGAAQGWLAGLGGEVFVDFGQLEGQGVVGFGNTVDIAYGYGFAPVALAAEDCVSEAVVHLHASYACFFDVALGGCNGFLDGEAVEVQRGAFGVNHAAFFGFERGLAHVGAFDEGNDGEVEVACEGVIAAVVCGHGHDSACAVAGEHVVANPHGHFLPREGVDGV